MTSEDDNHHPYRPISRIKMACTVCRQRKIRCSGEQPRCRNCRRTSQDCHYPSRNRQLTRDGNNEGSSSGASTALLYNLETKFSTLESRLSNIEKLLGSVLTKTERIFSSSSSTQESVAEGHQSHSPIESSSQGKAKEGSWHSGSVPSNSGSMVNFAGEGNAGGIRLTDIISPAIVLHIADVYFTYCHHQPYSFFHKDNFLKSLANGHIPDYLILAVLANGVRYSSHQLFKGRVNECAATYADHAWHIIMSKYFVQSPPPDLSVVQAVALISIFDFTAGKTRHGSAWLKSGIAVRVAQDLKLMIETHDSNTSDADKEERRRVFWSVYILDRLGSCGRARPLLILDPSCQLRLPIDDSLYKQGCPNTTPTLEQSSDFNVTVVHDPYGSFANEVLTAHTLGRTVQYMLQHINISSHAPPWDAHSGYATLHSELLRLETLLQICEPITTFISRSHRGNGDIDHTGIGPVVFARAVFHLCYILLNHPFLLRQRLHSVSSAPSSFLNRAFETGWEQSKQLVLLLRETRCAGCFIRNPFYGYCVLVAATVIAMHLPCVKASVAEEAETLLQETIFIVEDIGRSWVNVATMAEGLKTFANNPWRFGSLPTDSPSIEELPAEDEETMWSLLDYGSLSNSDPAAPCVPIQLEEQSLWEAFGFPWYDIVQDSINNNGNGNLTMCLTTDNDVGDRLGAGDPCPPAHVDYGLAATRTGGTVAAIPMTERTTGLSDLLQNSFST